MAVPLDGIHNIKDKFYIFKYKDNLDRTEFDKQNPLYLNEIPNSKPKIFSWILGKNKADKWVFYAREAKDILELFSKHIALLMDVDCNSQTKYYNDDNCINTIEYAGEMRTGPSEYNVLSGTYMKSKRMNTSDELTTLLNRITGLDLVASKIKKSIIVNEPNLKQIYNWNIVDIYQFDTKKDAVIYREINDAISNEKKGIKIEQFKQNKLNENLKKLEKVLPVGMEFNNTKIQKRLNNFTRKQNEKSKQLLKQIEDSHKKIKGYEDNIEEFIIISKKEPLQISSSRSRSHNRSRSRSRSRSHNHRSRSQNHRSNSHNRGQNPILNGINRLNL